MTKSCQFDIPYLRSQTLSRHLGDEASMDPSYNTLTNVQIVVKIKNLNLSATCQHGPSMDLLFVGRGVIDEGPVVLSKILSESFN